MNQFVNPRPSNKEQEPNDSYSSDAKYSPYDEQTGDKPPEHRTIYHFISPPFKALRPAGEISYPFKIGHI